MKILSALTIAIALITLSGCQKAAQEISTTISGTVSDNGTALPGAFVLLLDSGELATGGMSLSNGSVTTSSGAYTVIEAQVKSYYVCAIKDVNGNNTYDVGVDLIGYYGTIDTVAGIPISVPSTVTIVNKGDDLTGIDIADLF
jgi:hypothetical protein